MERFKLSRLKVTLEMTAYESDLNKLKWHTQKD